MVIVVVTIVVGIFYWYQKTNGGKKPSQGGCLFDSDYNINSFNSLLNQEPSPLSINRMRPSNIVFDGEGETGWRIQATYSFNF